jgi:glycine/D-amino acid oxidase-like deaminating enzyme
VAILGGGIVGITTAFLLKEAGTLSIAVIEADKILDGVTGHTKAKVTSQHHLSMITCSQSLEGDRQNNTRNPIRRQ